MNSDAPLGHSPFTETAEEFELRGKSGLIVGPSSRLRLLAAASAGMGFSLALFAAGYLAIRFWLWLEAVAR
jgi:hypothetical protein